MLGLGSLLNMEPNRRTTVASGLGLLQRPVALIPPAKTPPNSKLGAKRTSASSPLEHGDPESPLTPPQSTNRKSSACGSTRAFTSKEKATPVQPAPANTMAPGKSKNEAIYIPSDSESDEEENNDSVVFLGARGFEGMNVSRFVQGTSNQVATGKSKNEAIYIPNDSDSDEEESDDSIVHLRENSSRVLKSTSPFARGSAPLTPEQTGKNPVANATASYISKSLNVLPSSGLPTPGQTPAGKGKKICDSRGEEEEEITLLPSPPSSSSMSRNRRTAQQPAISPFQPGVPQTPPRAAATSATFGSARPADVNPQHLPSPFYQLPSSVFQHADGVRHESRDTPFNAEPENPSEGEQNVDPVGEPRFPESEISSHLTRLWKSLVLKSLPWCLDTPEGRLCELPNGDRLTWFQTRDFVRVLWGQVGRHYLRMTGHGAHADAMVQGNLLHYEMGLGKTHVAVAVLIHSRRLRKEINKQLGLDIPLKPDLIIAPRSIHSHWADHINRLSGQELIVEILQGGEEPVLSNADVIIATIDTARNHYSRLLACLHTFQDRAKVDERFARLGWDGVVKHSNELKEQAFLAIEKFNSTIIDECQGISNCRTQSGRTVLSLNTDNVLELSGTPAQGSLDDLQIHFTLMAIHASRRKDFSELERKHWELDSDSLECDPRTVNPKDVLDFVDAQRFPYTHQECIITRKAICPMTGQALIPITQLHEYVVKTQRNQNHTSRESVTIHRQRQSTPQPAIVRNALLESSDNGHVPFLRLPSNAAIRGEEYFARIYEGIPGTSKFKAVYTILEQIPNGEKTLIFSMFPSHLDRLRSFLARSRIKYVQYDGRMSLKERDDALNTIANDGECRVMLISLKVGGIGLNITACNHIIIFDPRWNLYVEKQAIARAYRRGQTRDVHVYRIICPKSKEDGMSEVREEKKIAIDAFIDKCALMTHIQDLSQRLN
ncbi:hypothetical protein EST38_g12802 [Candolleomyces aberdarensis]|uniref:Helicase C-terminal domain-containing protein n=1 Tax=Candolleomyces aberdarensis TaxID=2316362 RepID=A0A4Q2D2N4_9AGAR|nr:hypothetical protein EST38_g12802 [Candolleomyces aberdarensis]